MSENEPTTADLVKYLEDNLNDAAFEGWAAMRGMRRAVIARLKAQQEDGDMLRAEIAKMIGLGNTQALSAEPSVVLDVAHYSFVIMPQIAYGLRVSTRDVAMVRFDIVEAVIEQVVNSLATAWKTELKKQYAAIRQAEAEKEARQS